MQHHFVIGRSTHPGLKRGKGPNQDSIGVAERSGGEAAYPMLILADGMGGYYGGEVASRMAVDTVKEIFSASDPDKTGLRAVLSDCIEGAHQKIGENAAADDLLSCMGSTIVLAVPTEQSVWIGNVGDSRAYLITAQGKIIQISYDHSLVMEQFRAGLITKEEADHHPRKNVLTMSLSGQRGKVDPFITEVPWGPGDSVLICSDGLWGPVPEDQIRSTVLAMDPQDAADKLVELANENGGPDNISVLIARNGEKVLPSDDPQKGERISDPETDTAEQDPQRWLKIILMVVLVLLVLGLILYFLKNKPDAAKALIEDRARLFAGRV